MNNVRTCRAVLAFCKQDLGDPLKMKKDFKTGDEIGQELAKAGVKTVILNACNSASFQNHTKGSNLAEVFLGHGIESVLAMAYEVVEEAVEIFMNVFYQSLLIKGLSVQDAARVSRLALRKNRSRRAPYMHTVQLTDYIVPVLYNSRPTPEPAEASTNLESRGTISSFFEHVLTSIKRVSPSRRETMDTMIPIRHSFVGRDSDVLSLEFLLSITRVILLHGQGGCGKSELLRYVSRWWKVSGWIKGSAYIDFAEEEGYSLNDFIDQISDQLGIARGSHSEDEIIGKLQSGKYLIVFDSVDALDTPIPLDLVSKATGLPMQLKSFIDAVTRDGSMVIVSSRQNTARIANITYSHQKYHLTGLSVLDSVDLLLHLALEPKTKLPETFHRRENIDYLHRVAILLEGNPGAIQMIVPTLQRANYDGETLLNELLYGVWKIDDGEWDRCRFVRSTFNALSQHSLTESHDTLIDLSHFAIFWTLMPQNLDYYYWFLYLSYSKYCVEGSFKVWITQEFQDLVEKAQMGRMLHKHWPGIEDKLLRGGFLEHASVKTDTGEESACYHVHPILTLMGRASLSEEALKEAKFGYVRQMLLWDKPRPGSYTSKIVSAEWNGAEQHEDYVHNMRAVAMAWSLDGDVTYEVERMGLGMFDLIYTMSMRSLYVNKRQPVLFIPLIWRHLLKIHMLVTLIRPRGVPSRSDLDAILTYSQQLCRVQADDHRKLPLITMALEAAECYKVNGPPGNPPTIPKELSWFELRHVEAAIAESNSIIDKAKELYERNLADDPSTVDSKIYNAIRRCQLQNLTHWASCVAQISAREGAFDAFDKEQVTSGMREFCGTFKAGSMIPNLSKFWKENEKAIASMKVRDQFSFAIQRNKDKVSKFGILAKGILDEPIMNAFADVAKEQGLPPGKILCALSEMIEVDNPELRALCTSMESALRMASGDTNGAASALQYNLQREALSSTTSTRWENLSDIHMQMYALAVLRNDKPDYKKGLTHLTAWWKQHEGINVPKRDICYGHLKYATCYNGLNYVARTARAVIECVRVVPTMTKADCADGDNVEGFSEWLHEQFASLDKLDVFRDPKSIVSAPPAASELLWHERIAIHQIAKKAREVQGAGGACEEAFDASMETMRKLRDTMKKLSELSENDGEENAPLDEVEKRLGEMAEMRSRRRNLGDG